jgi:hypothetical protein
MIRAGENGYLVDDFERTGYAGIGWREAGDFTSVDKIGEMRELLARAYRNKKPGWLVNATGTTFKFRRIIRPGDRVVTYDPKRREYLIGTVEGDYEYKPGLLPDYNHVRKVRWEGRVSRDSLSQRSRNTLGGTLTIFQPGAEVLDELLQLRGIPPRRAGSPNRPATRRIAISGEPEFEWVDEYTPGHRIHFQRQPFGDADAEAYLAFAKSDLSEGDARGLVNAFGNAKRAIHYQIERLLWHLGFDPDRMSASFPSKLKILADLHVIPPYLLRTYNQKRNEIEHEYILPDEESTTTIVDLAELLLRTTTLICHRLLGSMSVLPKANSHAVSVELDPGSHTIVLNGVKISLGEPTRSEWFPYLRLIARDLDVDDPFPRY